LLLLIPKYSECVGKINTTLHIRVEGTVRGRILADSVHVVSGAEVDGKILTRKAVIHGRVIGDILATESFLLGSRGSVKGKVYRSSFAKIRLTVQHWYRDIKEAFFSEPPSLAEFTGPAE